VIGRAFLPHATDASSDTRPTTVEQSFLSMDQAQQNASACALVWLVPNRWENEPPPSWER